MKWTDGGQMTPTEEPEEVQEFVVALLSIGAENEDFWWHAADPKELKIYQLTSCSAGSSPDISK